MVLLKIDERCVLGKPILGHVIFEHLDGVLEPLSEREPSCCHDRRSGRQG
jgi:hypothetical protein